MSDLFKNLLGDDEDGDAFRDRCAVVGVWDPSSVGHAEAAKLAYLMLYAQQHRGQESAGIVSGDGETLKRKVGPGLVADVFSENDLATLIGGVAIGHCRYATAGDQDARLRDAGPVFARCQAGPIAVAHNGNLVNAEALRQSLEERGSIFTSSVDTEVVLHLMASSHGTLLERLQKSLKQVRGAYCLTVAGDGRLYGARDPSGVRPLALGRIDREGGQMCWVLASETCAFDLVGATYIRDVAPGEIVVIDAGGVTSHRIENIDQAPQAFCIFEHVYFARPDSLVFQRYVHEARHALGKQLAKETHIDADVVVPVPDSGVFAAMGYAEQARIPFAMGLVRNHYVGRTFIEPEQRIRHFGVKLKLNPVRSILAGKRVVVVDDSIVRGTTSKKIVDMILSAGAAEVHLRIAAPPTTHPCFYGIDTPTKEELVAHRLSVDDIRRFVNATTLGYLSRAGMHAAVAGIDVDAAKAAIASGASGFCDACFSGDYPIQIGGHKARR
ncbi:MAG: amidophosphoribosyltransferase [Deltaproteobacteria bacterium]|nr:amidophosphoribosyltransferase [Deltaproteobacteria bacterium]